MSQQDKTDASKPNNHEFQFDKLMNRLSQIKMLDIMDPHNNQQQQQQQKQQLTSEQLLVVKMMEVISKQNSQLIDALYSICRNITSYHFTKS